MLKNIFRRATLSLAIACMALSLVPSAMAKMAQQEAVKEFKRQITEWEKDRRVEDIQIIDANRDKVKKQIVAGDVDLQRIVDEVKGRDTSASTQSKKKAPSAKKESKSENNTVAVQRKYDKIPESNKPVATYARLESSFSGFPATLQFDAVMDLYFPNGNTVTCSNWDPTVYDPTEGSVGTLVKNCEVSQGRPEGEPNIKFEKGQTIDIDFGRISAQGYDWTGSSSSEIAGANVRMTKDGRIALGRYRSTSVSSGGNGVATSRKPRVVKGKYFLDGHTITITTDDNEKIYGFIGAQSNSGSTKIDHLYINGEHFWNRKK